MELAYIFRNTLCRLLLLSALTARATGQTYEATMAIYRDKLGGDNYNTEIRPIKDQSRAIFVNVSFELVSIVEVNDVLQSFVCNGFLVFSWHDQRIVWDPANYNGQTVIHPLPEKIWRPRVILMNTLGERDLFADHKSPVFMFHNGKTIWVPGSLFPSACELHMKNYPFDEQTCVIQIVAMSLTKEELQFVTSPSDLGIGFSTTHEEWDLQHRRIEALNVTTESMSFSSVQLTFTLKRRPFHVLINILFPVIFLSFLNLLVFFIPVKPGEKISYGITVLLALTVFMSMMSDMLPRSSHEMPKVTIYIFILLGISVLTVVDSIVIVFLHHLKEKESIHQKAKNTFKRLYRKVSNLRLATSPTEKSKNDGFKRTQRDETQDALFNDDERPKRTDAGGNKLGHRKLSVLSTASSVTRLSCDLSNQRGQLQPLAQNTNEESSAGEPSEHDDGDREEGDQRGIWKTAKSHSSQRGLLEGAQCGSSPQDQRRTNKYRLIGGHIDLVSFVVFLLVWTGVTLGFLFHISS